MRSARSLAGEVSHGGTGWGVLGLAGLAQVALLALLWRLFGLGLAGWFAGLGFACCLTGLLAAGLRDGRTRLGPADRITLLRAVFACVITALVAEHCSGFLREQRSESRTVFSILLGLTALALALDALDGRIARRTETASAFGARFDMETDAWVILVLSAYAATVVGWWALLIGAMRYLFLAASRVFGWLTAPLPPSFARKTVAALQGILLMLAMLLGNLGLFTGQPSFGQPSFGRPAAITLAALALVLLCWSFGRDIRWLHRNR
ncbi:CDP-alcohol phosphatidyltransferase family protein [Sciscionella sediminilitoris]|uniref:CDP-alcohol phosphatidyltransferase family protein n=1 Tax=Sciscionella sediminilitoris TaxID=1445613 RepID=UPI001E30891B|nr:CDP-alcohol phosphatidyltransferase family protein [Sciscionella sp. SE31]